MGARTLEAKLIRRVLGVVATALGVVGAASVAITWWALDAADTSAARQLAEETVAAMRSELKEPDPFDQAANQVLEAMNDIGASVVIVEPATHRAYASKIPVVPELTGTPAGSCASASDSATHWRGCAVREPYVEVVATIDTSAHSRVVWTVAEGVSLVILLALVLAAMAARASLIGALASVRALAAWSERVVNADGAPPAPVADTEELARLGAAFDAVVRHLTDAVARARATSENIAHELRSPLTAIRAELDALASGAPPSSVAEAVSRLRGDVEGLSRVVDAILVLAVPPKSSAAIDCVVNLADLARELAPEGTLVEAPDEALVVGEPRLIELAIANLLENARKHTGREARTIRVARTDGAVRVAVIDDGPGLSDEARARMFDRYWRGSERGGGTGLGLALVRAVAKRHGGEADARDNAGRPGLEVGVTFGNVVGWHEEK